MKGFTEHGKDVDQKLLSYMTDKEILEKCSLNSYFNNVVCSEDFFKRLVEARYPSLLQYKERKTYKQFYLWLVYYISKLQEDFEIILSPGENPQSIYDEEVGKALESYGGFSQAVVASPALVDFLRNANLGTVDGPEGQGSPLQTLLTPLLERGIFNRAMLTVLFSIYFKNRNLGFIQKGKKYFRVGDDMNRYLNNILTQMEIEERDKEQRIDAKGNLVPRFNRHGFQYNRILNIVNKAIDGNVEATLQDKIDLYRIGKKLTDIYKLYR